MCFPKNPNGFSEFLGSWEGRHPFLEIFYNFKQPSLLFICFEYYWPHIRHYSTSDGNVVTQDIEEGKKAKLCSCCVVLYHSVKTTQNKPKLGWLPHARMIICSATSLCFLGVSAELHGTGAESPLHLNHCMSMCERITAASSD